MNMDLKSRFAALRLESRWRRVLRLRKRAEKRYIVTGSIDSRSFRAAYRRLDRRCAGVMALERRYEVIRGRDTEPLEEVTAVLV